MKPTTRINAADTRKRISGRNPRKRMYKAVAAGGAGLAVLGVVIAGYVVGTGNDAQATPASSVTGPVQHLSSGAVVKLASWSGGGTIDLSNPGKPTVILAIAGWCATCIQPARDLSAINREFAPKVRVLAVSVYAGDSEQTLARFRGAAGDPSYEWGFDPVGSVAAALNLRFLDTVVVLDATGHEIFRGVRPSNGTLQQVLQPLVARGQ